MVKEKILFNNSDKALAFLMDLQKEQRELDDAKKRLAEVRHLVRSKSQLIPDKLRRFKL